MKSNRYLIPIFILIAGLALFMAKLAPQTEVKERVDTTKTDFLGEPVEQKTAPIQIKAAATQSVKNLKPQNLEKCASFLKTAAESEKSTLEKTLAQIKEHYQISNEAIDSTEYQLLTRSNEELVVQHIPNEEQKNKVRVFKTGPDGFPDRIKTFPHSAEAEDLRLIGALSLGTLNKKIEKYKTENNDRSILTYEKSNGEITRLDFINGRNQLICEDQLCQCHEF
jgi:hypothetical protein